MKLELFKKMGIFLIFLIIFSVPAFAHSNILYNVSLDFDKNLKENVIKTAQNYFNLNEKPIKFDFDRELINVNFARPLDYYVTINPLDYSVFGFRDQNLKSKDKTENYNDKQRFEIAEKVLEQIPDNYKNELVYGEEKKLYSGIYQYTWYRYVNNILVANEYLQVEVDPNTGQVIAWKLSIFSSPKESIKTTPAITYQVAQKIAELKLNALPIDFKPVLIIFDNIPIWLVKVKGLYPVFAGVNALTGELLFSGGARAELPLNYDYGRTVNIVETDFIKKIYGGL